MYFLVESLRTNENVNNANIIKLEIDIAHFRKF